MRSWADAPIGGLAVPQPVRFSAGDGTLGQLFVPPHAERGDVLPAVDAEHSHLLVAALAASDHPFEALLYADAGRGFGAVEMWLDLASHLEVFVQEMQR